MRRPCWHFLQAGHSFTSSMRHPPSPDPPLLPALHAGPAVAGPEHLREIVDSIEVFRLVARLPGEQPDVDQREHHASQSRGARDTPVTEHGRREEPELLEREVPARPRELRAREMAARRQPPLRVLERREHEQVAALVVAGVLLPDALERLFQGGEVAHGRASAGPDGRARSAATGLESCDSSSACSSTSSIDRKSTRLNSSHSQISYAVFCLKKKKKMHVGGGLRWTVATW